MSKFLTSIPVDVDSVTKALPAGSYLHKVEYNEDTKAVDVVWDCDAFVTPFDHPVEFPVAKLQALQTAPAPIPEPAADATNTGEAPANAPAENQNAPAKRKRGA